jgi:HlyD family secretion protein
VSKSPSPASSLVALPVAHLIVSAIVGGLLGCAAGCGGKDDKAPVYETEKVANRDLKSSVTASGSVSPLVTVQVGSQVSGRIQSLHADFNSTVTKGQVVARIDPRVFESEVRKVRANLLVAKATAARVEVELADAQKRDERTKSLRSKGYATEAETDATAVSLASLRAQLDSANATAAQVRATLEQAEANLAYTTIVSPIDGVVISRSVDVGQTVTASLQAPTLFTIAEDLRRMEVHTSVAESDVGRVAPGLTVEFTVDAFPTTKFSGTVKEVRYSPQTVQNVVTYDAVVVVDNPEGKLRPGMTADVTFMVEQKTGVVAVPNKALRFRPPDEVIEAAGGGDKLGTAKGDKASGGGGPPGGGNRGGGKGAGATERVVWVRGADQKLGPKKITVGISDGEYTEVVAGELRIGDAIVTGEAGPVDDKSKSTFGRFL